MPTSRKSDKGELVTCGGPISIRPIARPEGSHMPAATARIAHLWKFRLFTACRNEDAAPPGAAIVDVTPTARRSCQPRSKGLYVQLRLGQLVVSRPQLGVRNVFAHTIRCANERNKINAPFQPGTFPDRTVIDDRPRQPPGRH